MLKLLSLSVYPRHSTIWSWKTDFKYIALEDIYFAQLANENKFYKCNATNEN